MSDADDQPVVYAVRLFERARRDIEAAVVRLADLEGDEHAVAWLEGMYEALAKLATQPRRFPIVAERFQEEVRQFLYRRTPGSAAYRVLFQIGDGENDDAPTVSVFHVRHAARRVISAREARELWSEQ